MPKHRITSEIEQRLSQKVMARVDGKERFDATKELLHRYQKSCNELIAAQTKMHENRKRSLIFLARMLFVPVTVLAAVYLFLVIGSGLFLGEVVDISKYSQKTILLQNEPALYWIAIAYHTCVTLFLAWASYLCGCGTKWFTRKTPNMKIDRDASGARH